MNYEHICVFPTSTGPNNVIFKIGTLPASPIYAYDYDYDYD